MRRWGTEQDLDHEPEIDRRVPPRPYPRPDPQSTGRFETGGSATALIHRHHGATAFRTGRCAVGSDAGPRRVRRPPFIAAWTPSWRTSTRGSTGALGRLGHRPTPGGGIGGRCRRPERRQCACATGWGFGRRRRGGLSRQESPRQSPMESVGAYVRRPNFCPGRKRRRI